MKSLTEYIKEHLINTVQSEHRINEMAQISCPEDQLKDGVEIWVYGENDEHGNKTPHFHVIGEDFEFEVYIEHIYELRIWRTKRIDKQSNTNTWNERSKIRKSIQKWLNEQNKDFIKMTNAEAIVVAWNQNNPSHKISQSFKD